ALDAEHRLVLSVVPGRQSVEQTLELVRDVARRTGGQPLNLFTSDENPAYAVALLEGYGVLKQRRRKGRRGRKPRPVSVPPPELVYATVHKTRENNRVVQVETRRVYGTKAALAEALARPTRTTRGDTADGGRQKGTGRHRHARDGRQKYEVSQA